MAPPFIPNNTYRSVPLPFSLNSIALYHVQRDPDGAITDFRLAMVNESALATWQLSRAELIGRSIHQLFTPNEAQFLQKQFEVVVETGYAVRFDLTLQRTHDEVRLQALTTKLDDGVLVSFGPSAEPKPSQQSTPDQVRSQPRFADQPLSTSASGLLAKLTTPTPLRHFRWVRLAGLLVIGLTLLSVAGWLFDLPWLYSYGLALISMKVNTAVLLLCTGVTLVWFSLTDGKASFANKALAGVTLGLSVWVIGLHAFTVTPGSVLWQYSTVFIHSPFGRPALLTAICMAFLNGAFLLIQHPKTLITGQLLTFFSALFVFEALMGYLLDLPAFYSFRSSSAIALPTAVCLWIISAGLLVATQPQGLFSSIAESTISRALFPYVALYLFVAPTLAGTVYLKGVTGQLIDQQLGMLVMIYLFTAATFGVVYWFIRLLNQLDTQNQTQLVQLARSEAEQRKQFELLTGIQNATQTPLSALKAIRNSQGEIDDFEFVFDAKTDRHLSGQSAVDVVGKRMRDVHPHTHENGMFDRYVQVVETGMAQRFEQEHRTDGVNGWFDIHASRWGDGVVVTVNDTTQLRQAERERLQQAETLQQVIDNTQAGLLLARPVLDDTGKITDFRYVLTNAYNANTVGRSVAELTGQLIGNLFPGWQQTDFFRRYVSVMETGKPVRLVFPFDDQGIEGWFDGSFSRVDDCVLYTYLNVTALKESELAQQRQADLLQVANHELKRSNESLQSFAYITSHDLQEPLRKISSFADVLHQQYAGQFSPEASDIIRRMSDSAQRMRQLIQDLLAYSRVETHRESLKPVNLTELVRQLPEEDLWEAFHRSRAELHLAELPTLVADSFQMRQLFQNLVGNAIKFCRNDVTPVITVSSRLVDRADVPAALVPPSPAGDGQPATFYAITVTDNGIGFEEKHVDRIFQTFQRLHTQQQFPGSGIGLAICKKIVERHAGAITAHSQLGEGSTFTVYLPTSLTP